MKIYTRTGDAGETGLFGGERVPKDYPRVAVYGDVDELNSVIGAAMAQAPADWEQALLTDVQRDLLTIGAELASPDRTKLANVLRGPPMGESRVTALEHAIDRLDAALPPLKNFILPGGAPKAAALHVARSVCRRAERGVVALARQSPSTVSGDIVRYLNRLSDLLFVLARAVNAVTGHRDTIW